VAVNNRPFSLKCSNINNKFNQENNNFIQKYSFFS